MYSVDMENNNKEFNMNTTRITKRRALEWIRQENRGITSGDVVSLPSTVFNNHYDYIADNTDACICLGEDDMLRLERNLIRWGFVRDIGQLVLTGAGYSVI